MRAADDGVVPNSSDCLIQIPASWLQQVAGGGTGMRAASRPAALARLRVLRARDAPQAPRALLGFKSPLRGWGSWIFRGAATLATSMWRRDGDARRFAARRPRTLARAAGTRRATGASRPLRVQIPASWLGLLDFQGCCHACDKYVAEGRGFEPRRQGTCLAVFKTAAFSRSAIPPRKNARHPKAPRAILRLLESAVFGDVADAASR